MDSFLTLAAPATAEFKDRGSRFLAYACPVSDENAALAQLEALRKEHFKANHHCFAWRFGTDGARFRANDDGEPSGTAGRPILSQIDSAGLTDVMIVVVRYFGGTLLGASGLINAYRESAQAALQAATIKEVVLSDAFAVTVDYALLPDLTQALHRLQIPILAEVYGEQTATTTIGIRKSLVEEKMLHLRAQVLKVSTEEAATREWPSGLVIEPAQA